MKRRLLVVGGVAAGPSAAAKAKRTNPNIDVTLFEQGEHISYGICEIPYYIGDVITDAEKLIVYSPSRLEKEKGVSVRVHHRVEEVIPSKRLLVVRNLANNRTVEHHYTKLILATGSRARSLDITGENGRNVFHVKSLEEGYAIKRFIMQEKVTSAVIIGGGYIGIEMAESLRTLGISTTLLHLDSLPMSGLETQTREAVLAELRKNGVEIVPHVRVRKLVHDTTGRVTDVETETARYETDLVIISAGVKPNSELAKNAGIRCGRYNGILTDQRQATNIDTIFAAGDCCEVKNIVSNRWMYIPLATTASKQGWTAGENAAGGSAAFKGVIRAIAVRAFDLEIAQVGLSTEEAEEAGFTVVVEHIVANSKVGYFPGNEEVNIIAMAEKRSGRLLGANVFGKQGAVLRANTLGVAIQQKLKVDEIARLDLIYSPPFAPLWDPILLAAQQLRKKTE
jgi:NADPH-dependent 2,4-dienoyl-CoA reductase/sulfur reductase-like enzyme